LIFAYSELGRIVERHVGNKVLNTKGAESTISEVMNSVSSKAVWLIDHPITLIICAVIIVGGLIAYSFTGKGSGSHAGREEVRRAYRRKLAQEMAKEDAAKIRSGEKPRRRWMQW